MRLRFLGGLSSIGGSCLLIEDADQAMLIDAGASNVSRNYALPDLQSLIPLGRRLRAAFFTHAHYDHAGAAAFLYDLFPDIQIFGSRETIAFLHGRYALPRSASVKIVQAGETFALGDWRLTPHAAAHSIPGTYAISLAIPSAGNIFVSADFKAFADPAEAARFASPDVFVCESTNAGVSAPPFGDAEVEVFLGECVARHKEARVLFSCFSTNLARLGVVLRAARGLNLKIYAEGKAIQNALMIARELYGDPLWGPYPALPRNKLPASGLALAGGCQGEEDSQIYTLIKKGFLSRSQDALILSASPIPGNESDWRHLLDTAAREPARSYCPPLAAVHASGHACRDGLAMAFDLIKPRFVLPVHGQDYQRRLLADLAAERGIPSRIMNDEEYLELADNGTVSVHALSASEKNAADQTALASASRERAGLARAGIAFIALVCDSEARRVYVKISLRGFFKNDIQTQFIQETCESLEAGVLELWSEGVFGHTTIRKRIQEQAHTRFMRNFAECPILSVLYFDLANPS